MKFVAWCDGSVKSNKNIYASYVIKNNKDQVVTQYKARIDGLGSKIQSAEYMAFYLLLKKIQELGLIDSKIKIYSDSACVVNDFLNRKKIRKQFPFREMIISSLGNKFHKKVFQKVQWKSRIYNQAHPLFKKKEIVSEVIDVRFISKIKVVIQKEISELKVERVGDEKTKKHQEVITIKTENPIKKEEKTKTINVEKKKTEKRAKSDIRINNSFISIPNTQFGIKEKAFKSFKSSVHSEKHNTDEKVLGLLHKKICSTLPFEDSGKKLLVTGKLHLYLSNNIIEEVRTNPSKWSDLWREKNQIHNIVIKVEKKKTNNSFISIPNTQFGIKEKAFNTFKSSVQSEKYNTDEKVLELLHKKICSTLPFEDNGKKVLVTGKLHMYLSYNIIEEVRTNPSKWSDLWREKNPIQNSVMKLKPFKNAPAGPAVIVPGTNILVEERILNKIQKSTSSLKDFSIKKTIELVSSRLNNSLKVNENGYEIYVLGRFHMYVANGFIQEYKIFSSRWTEISRIERKEKIAV